MLQCSRNACASAMEEVFGANGTLARETPGEAVLVSRLPAALERLNPLLPPEAIAAGKLKAYRRGWIQLHRQVLAILEAKPRRKPRLWLFRSRNFVGTSGFGYFLAETSSE